MTWRLSGTRSSLCPHAAPGSGPACSQGLPAAAEKSAANRALPGPTCSGTWPGPSPGAEARGRPGEAGTGCSVSGRGSGVLVPSCSARARRSPLPRGVGEGQRCPRRMQAATARGSVPSSPAGFTSSVEGSPLSSVGSRLPRTSGITGQRTRTRRSEYRAPRAGSWEQRVGSARGPSRAPAVGETRTKQQGLGLDLGLAQSCARPSSRPRGVRSAPSSPRDPNLIFASG